MSLEETISKITGNLAGLDTGALAELRRMNVDGPPVPIFWQVMAGIEIASPQTLIWKQIVKILALWVPKGERKKGFVLHNTKRSLGRTFCDGGTADWSGGSDARPVISETRLARLLAQPRAQRGAALERTVRALTRSRDPDQGIDCIEIAALLLTADDNDKRDRIARDYYNRLDVPNRQLNSKTTEGTNQ